MELLNPHLEPGELPYTRMEARESARAIRARVEEAFAPYRARAQAAHHRIYEPDGSVDRVADQFDVSRDEVIEQLDVDRLVNQGAMVELLLDLIHLCAARDLSFNRALAEANGVYQAQMRQMQKFLVHEAIDEERPSE